MQNVIRKHFVLKIFLAFILVVIFSGIILAVAMNFSIESTYEKHIGRLMSSEGQQQSEQKGNRGSTLYENFKAAVNESLLFSSIAAFLIAGTSSILISRQISKPLRSITRASQEIANGNYTQRVEMKKDKGDELAQLGRSFNRMANKLEQTETIRRQLIGDISHELRTPLTAIKGSMEGLMDGVLPNDESTYTHIYREADRLQRLVEDLQELSRVEGSALKLILEKTDIDALIQNALSPLLNTFEKKGIQVSILSENNLPPVMADHDRILQVLQNLLGNAHQFSRTKGAIEINARKIDANIQITVADNGAGINARDLPHIFERFYRADRSRSRRNGGGSGIGLTIARSLVEAHGGKIWATSDGEGHGSAFTFTLPI